MWLIVMYTLLLVSFTSYLSWLLISITTLLCMYIYIYIYTYVTCCYFCWLVSESRRLQFIASHGRNLYYYICIYMYIYIYEYMHIHVCVYIYIYILIIIIIIIIIITLLILSRMCKPTRSDSYPNSIRLSSTQ